MKPNLVNQIDDKPVYEYRRSWLTNRYEKTLVFQDLSMNLPLDASIAGMTLTLEVPDDDPIYLKDKYGNVLHEWEKPPSLSEVREIALKNLGGF